ncbi:MAG TPA: hypothetical protein VGM73_13165 [Candidatus Didemnitutus sp.]
MSRFSKTRSHHPFFSIGEAGAAVAEGATTTDPFRDAVERWHELSTDHPATRLFCLEPVGDAPYCWMAEVTVGERTHRRRCASELYARWWLHAFVEPVHSPDPTLRTRLDEPLVVHAVS